MSQQQKAYNTKPAPGADGLGERIDQMMRKEIFQVIAKYTPYSVESLESFYRSLPSLDLLVAACDHAARSGTPFPSMFPVEKVHCPKCGELVGLAREAK